MKILLLNTFDIDGGAARSAYRLHQGLQTIGASSQMLVQAKSGNNSAITAPKTNLSAGIARIRVSLEALPLKLYPKRQVSSFSSQWLPESVIQKVSCLNPDVINLHWINQGFVQIETLAKFKQPIVWTLHDMWSFTGGCHYAQDCDRYVTSCGSCPQLSSKKDGDLSRWIWKRKAKSWQKLDLTVVTPSKWLSQCARASSLFSKTRVEVIPYGIDTAIYRPTNRSVARELLNLPHDKYLILFSALATGDKRKGFHLLEPALIELSQNGWAEKIELVVLGASRPENPTKFGFKSHYLGSLKDDLSIALIYAAADVFVAPSVQDNLPNTILESISCGTPCVAFNVGGIPDMIEHQRNGYLAEPFEVNDLAQGIVWVLNDKERYAKLAYRAREKAEQEFTLTLQAERYMSLFTDVKTDGNNRRL